MALPPPYSVQFMVFTAGEGPLEYEVPPGYTAVIRDVTVFDNIGGAILVLSIQNSLEALQCQAISVTAAGVPGFGQWTGRVVVPGGGFITATITHIGDGPSFYVGGYLLQGGV